jgi:hypothetical protein
MSKDREMFSSLSSGPPSTAGSKEPKQYDPSKGTAAAQVANSETMFEQVGACRCNKQTKAR